MAHISPRPINCIKCRNKSFSVSIKYEYPDVQELKELYGNDADYNGKTLTYYVTVPTVINSTTGETSEHLEKHTVNIKGEIST